MCGVVGFAEPESGPLRIDHVRAGLVAMAHRGPDASGAEELSGPGTRCVLGAVRLRIIDLSPEGDQPMAGEDGTVWVAYNGELYNHGELREELSGRGHRFVSKTDTEVLVHLFEEHREEPREMLDRLRGMFALAIFDRVSGRLFLARDRLGIKPLYWAETPRGGVAFASEIRSLAAGTLAGAEPDRESVNRYLLRGVVPGPATILEGVNELPPGSFLTWRGGTVEQQRWWTIAVRPEVELQDDAESLMRAALVDSVSRHLVSDRPVGVFLSGGVDSGVVATTAAALGPTRTFTVTFPDAGDDEGHEAAMLASKIGASHDIVPVLGNEVFSDFESILRAMDQPTLDGINTWLVSGGARKAGLVVALSGLGGDELFGGYSTFDHVLKVRQIRNVLSVVPSSIRMAGARVAGHRTPGGRASRILASSRGIPGAYWSVRQVFSRPELGLPGLAPNGNVSAGERLSGETDKSLDPRDAITLLEATGYMADQLLRDTDQMTMSHSQEVRVPLLDDSFVRVALAVPASVRLAHGKALLAKAGRLDEIPRKRVFALPFDRWLRGPLRETLREGLLSEALPFSHEIPPAFRQRLWDQLDTGRMHWSRPWSVMVLRMWPGANGFKW